ncbi:hypothetical protein QN363_17240 [Undibacterium sp. CCC2.1]|nr:hypothetical protein [Undibacterium sp. CCC2.1]MEB0140775.1 hypothetical protein [Undibacterium sp. CCC2.1]
MKPGPFHHADAAKKRYYAEPLAMLLEGAKQQRFSSKLPLLLKPQYCPACTLSDNDHSATELEKS